MGIAPFIFLVKIKSAAASCGSTVHASGQKHYSCFPFVEIVDKVQRSISLVFIDFPFFNIPLSIIVILVL